MKISDEIRKVADEYDVLPLYKLADRIDAEMVELPKDADGVPIHVGDTVYLDDGRKAEVTRIDLLRCTSCIVCWASGKDCDCLPSGISHTVPDSWERIADELKRYANDSYSEDEIDGMTDSTLVDFADRIRKLAKKEGEQCQ